jgi:xanthine dehydrogenase accessory factor
VTHWIDWLERSCASDAVAVLVTVVATRGSVPRPAGTRMLVLAGSIEGSIGGGHLEFDATAIARALAAGGGAATLRRFTLGASLGQCCGGVVELLFEPIRGRPPWLDALAAARREAGAVALVTALRGLPPAGHLVVTATARWGTLGSADDDEEAVALARPALGGGEPAQRARLTGESRAECFVEVVRPSDFAIVLFGAGHVGRALVRLLAGLPCRVAWVDSRDAIFPPDVPANVQCVATDAPEAEAAAAPPGAFFLVMTHSHALDERLVEAILARGDFAYCGLIGSRAKRRRFELRLEARGTPRERLASITCPIGVPGVEGKEPGVIAIAVAAELLQIRARRAAAASARDRRRA